ncbi:hypothetical protein JXO59_06985 [candidate division KSB1 bacterium]|nr:hypothetical protein [candidate division KSB1 bacterium]
MKTNLDAIELIRTCCGDLQERIHACRSKHIAEQLKDRLCKELSHKCQSEMVHLLLISHIDKIIQETFDEEGRNQFLEEE